METCLEELLGRMSHQKSHSSHPGVKHKYPRVLVFVIAQGNLVSFIMPPHEGARVG